MVSEYLEQVLGTIPSYVKRDFVTNLFYALLVYALKDAAKDSLNNLDNLRVPLIGNLLVDSSQMESGLWYLIN